MYIPAVLIRKYGKKIQSVHKAAVGGESYISLTRRVEWFTFCLKTGEGSTKTISRREYCFVGLAELVVLFPSLP